MADARGAKLRRLDKFRRNLPHVSASALSAILDEVVRHGVPDVRSRGALRESREKLALAMTPYGYLLQHVKLTVSDKPSVDIPIIHPHAILCYACTECSAWDAILARS